MGKRARLHLEEQAAFVLKNSTRSAFLRVCGARVAAGGRVQIRATFTQAQLAKEMGVATELIRTLMQECYMPEQVRLDHGTGNLVATNEGHEKIRELLAAQMAAAVAPTPPTPPAPTVPAVKTETLIVTRPHWSAKRVVANRESNGLEVICCVQASANFTGGMKLTDCREGDGGLWYYTGRLPRRKGHW